jgi:hypothetical protein
MRFIVLCLAIFFINLISVNGQSREEKIPGTYWCPNDTFLLKFKGEDRIFKYTVSDPQLESPGTAAGKDEYATIYFGNDSLRLNYHNNIPYGHIIYVDLASPKGKATFRFHYNDLVCLFSPAYVQQHRGTIQYDIPEVYELANIILALSPAGQRAGNMDTESEYYKRVTAYFKPYTNHAVFKSLDFPDSVYMDKYYDFRQNSWAFNFERPGTKQTRLLFNGPYYYVYGRELADSSLFGKLKPLVEDFAARSKFRQFYKDNYAFYQEQLKRQKELLPVKQMWAWLEQEFGRPKIQSYRIVFSPLILSSHSTQTYGTYLRPEFFRENVMYICGPAHIDEEPGLTEKQKEGLMSGIVFTEIDHNYVNPATSAYEDEADSIFGLRSRWVTPNLSSDYYEDGIDVFNEYMTHAVFCLYVLDTYDHETADFLVKQRERLMEGKRGFPKFGEFNRELIRLRQANKGMKIIDLYPLILDWAGKQI